MKESAERKRALEESAQQEDGNAVADLEKDETKSLKKKGL